MADIIQIDVGTLPHQVPTNGDLGDLAFMDKAALEAGMSVTRQANLYDTTSGAVLEVGSFGVGGQAVVSNNLNSIRVNCVVQTTASDPNKPPSGTFVETINANGLFFQRSVSATSNQTQYTRYGFDVSGTITYSAWAAISGGGGGGTPIGTNIGDAMGVGGFGVGYGGKNAPMTAYTGNIDIVTGASAVPWGWIYYSTDSSTGTAPLPSTYGTLFTHYGVVQSSNVTARQVFYETFNLGETGRIYYRSMWGTTWGPWVKVLTEVDLAGSGGAPTAWVAPTLTNGWANYTPATYETCGYRKNNGNVELKGCIYGPSNPTSPMFTLPVGHRPAKTLVIASTGYIGSAIQLVTLTIAPTGVVSIAQPSAGAAGWVSLDNVRIPIA